MDNVLPEDGQGEMFRLVSALSHQLDESASLAGLAAIPSQVKAVPRIILCGMGGSAIAGDLVQPLLLLPAVFQLLKSSFRGLQYFEM